MYSILIVILLIGIIMVIDGIYREEITRLKNNKQIEYKFIPRNMYEDSIFFSPHKSTYEQLFEKKHDTRSAGRYI
tara:strand:+ start:249 stop:473 length:225 start_codon:yes stop_codon:yes gene_type:complete